MYHLCGSIILAEITLLLDSGRGLCGGTGRNRRFFLMVKPTHKSAPSQLFIVPSHSSSTTVVYPKDK